MLHVFLVPKQTLLLTEKNMSSDHLWLCNAFKSRLRSFNFQYSYSINYQCKVQAMLNRSNRQEPKSTWTGKAKTLFLKAPF